MICEFATHTAVGEPEVKATSRSPQNSVASPILVDLVMSSQFDFLRVSLEQFRITSSCPRPRIVSVMGTKGRTLLRIGYDRLLSPRGLSCPRSLFGRQGQVAFVSTL
jgi:hypothetical protein